MCAQRRLRSDWAVWSESSLCAQWVAKNPSFFMRTAKTLISVDAQADLSVRWAHMPLCWFWHDAAHMYNKTGGRFWPHWVAAHVHLKDLKPHNAKDHFLIRQLIICFASASLFRTCLNKQCRPRSDAAEHGVWSGSTPFAFVLIFIKN